MCGGRYMYVRSKWSLPESNNYAWRFTSTRKPLNRTSGIVSKQSCVLDFMTIYFPVVQAQYTLPQKLASFFMLCAKLEQQSQQQIIPGTAHCKRQKWPGYLR